MDAGQVVQFLAEHPPFDSLSPDELQAVAAASTLHDYVGGELVFDAFTDPLRAVFVVLDGRVELWNHAAVGEADEIVEPGGVFGFSAMLTERPMGPRAVAAGSATVARIPATQAAPAFASRRGARFLIEAASTARNRDPGAPSYSVVDDLIVRAPLVVGPAETIGAVARRMTDADLGCAVVHDRRGPLGLITDALLRRYVLVEGRATDTPVEQVMDTAVPTVRTGESSVEALLLLLDREAEYVVVTTRGGDVRGVLAPRDFAISPTTAGVSLHERLRRASCIDELTTTARGVPTMLGELLAHGLASGRVITVYSAMLDTIVRRSIEFVFRGARRPLRRHVHLAVAGQQRPARGRAQLRRRLGGGVRRRDSRRRHRSFPCGVQRGPRRLAEAGLSSDDHGATARRPCSPAPMRSGAPRGRAGSPHPRRARAP